MSIEDLRRKFHVIAVVSNPLRYESRVRLYKEFATRMVLAGVQLHTVEIAFGDRPFEVTEFGNPNHLQLRTFEELWHKENMINLGIQKVIWENPDAEYLAWVDADVAFARTDWVDETIHQLQHHMIVQMWSNSVDLDPDGKAFGQAKSFASYHASGAIAGANVGYYGYWHSGYAWAARREALDTTGGLLDFAILGSGDFYMAWGMRGSLGQNLYNDVASLPHRKQGFTENYIKRLFQWQERAKRLKGDIGVVDGTLLHYWHGKKKQRQYNTRENILINNRFDPDTDLVRDCQGLWQLVTVEQRQVKMRDDIRLYMRQRNEDSIDLA